MEDRLPFNAEGYKVLTAIVRKHLPEPDRKAAPAPVQDAVRIGKDVD